MIDSSARLVSLLAALLVLASMLPFSDRHRCAMQTATHECCPTPAEGGGAQVERACCHRVDAPAPQLRARGISDFRLGPETEVIVVESLDVPLETAAAAMFANAYPLATREKRFSAVLRL